MDDMKAFALQIAALGGVSMAKRKAAKRGQGDRWDR
jgi:hypothetical protein